MTNLTSRQHEYLKAMGIDVWMPKDALAIENVEQENPAVIDLVSSAPPVVKPVSQSKPEPDAVVKTALQQMPASGLMDNDVSTLDWNALQARVAECRLCELHLSRKQTVFGAGNKQADWLIIGEAPGIDEDRQGEPFVGQAGLLLNAMLQAIGLARQQVYLANILKCHPPKNRDPQSDEASNCMMYLQRQIELVQPKIILALGRIAAQSLLQTNTSLVRLRGKVHYIEATSAPVIVTYHPAYLMRSPLEKRNAWEDLLFAVRTMKEQTA
ncbi:MAG: uracil-DNA glycosylase [Gammaproteobacteria bacterium]|nr:uracil-DNA glycosylase [Gammaproteobacteria bacterium]